MINNHVEYDDIYDGYEDDYNIKCFLSKDKAYLICKEMNNDLRELEELLEISYDSEEEFCKYKLRSVELDKNIVII